MPEDRPLMTVHHERISEPFPIRRLERMSGADLFRIQQSMCNDMTGAKHLMGGLNRA